MKRLVLLMSVLAMMLAAAAPDLAQTGQVVPGSGGDGAALLTLGLGVALIACGLLVRRVFGKF